jgi:hypothetical protein
MKKPNGRGTENVSTNNPAEWTGIRGREEKSGFYFGLTLCDIISLLLPLVFVILASNVEIVLLSRRLAVSIFASTS